MNELQNVPVLVVGDVMLDCYISGRITRRAPESGAPVLLEESRAYMPGGAANVALNLAAMQADVTLIGLVGADADGHRLAGLLERDNLALSLPDAGRPTICKTRISSDEGMILRHDCEVTQPVSDVIEAELITRINESAARAVILSDYIKGCISDGVIAAAMAKNIPLLVDSKAGDLSRFKGAMLVTPNRTELQARYPDLEEEQAGQRLCRESGIDAVLLTRSEEGAALIRPDQETLFFPAEAKQVVEVSGAGDSVIAATALALASGWSLEEACALGNKAGSRAVEKQGTTALTREDLV